MRFTTEEKMEIIKLFEGSELGVNQTLRQLGIHKSTFYNWYNRYLQRGQAGLKPNKPKHKNYWNRIPDEIRGKVIDLALDLPDLSPRELASTMSDQHGYFVSESSVYRILKKADLITSPAYILLRASDEF